MTGVLDDTELLNDIRIALGGDVKARRAEVAQWMTRRQPGPLPSQAKLPAENVLDAFNARARSASCTVDVVPTAQDATAILGAALQRWGVAPSLVASPDPLLRSWLEPCKSFEVRFGGPTPNDTVGVVLPIAAVAETGTLVLRSGTTSPTALAFLPDYLVAIVPRSRIVATYEVGLERAITDVSGGIPRCINLITGPSRTADIEEILLLGAHGPRTVHILVIDGL
jgi:L-lactate dehydrogenase complex protein LldG